MAVAKFSDIALHAMDLSDINSFAAWATDNRVSRFCTWDTFTSKEEGIRHITNTVLPHPWYRAICLDDHPVGSVSMRPGRGIMMWAVKMAVAAIFREWPKLLRLQALVDVENVGSIRVQEKAGFRTEGVLRKYIVLKGRARDLVTFSLLSSDDH
ncbi:hypothetical protein EUGRSUZ_B01057 [Eucalyptus grandis]|uniref:Uncharacterized protein n=2 Tax=Eucalyptus grandis TaxID=71139 RepID=A0ACC3LP15_EUCGR|nr:hypothetical protein EUGRSUZ_B01057 [Eucalyptus grandis]